MRITVLSENTTSSNELGCEHGLSLYIETAQHKILFDMGASDLFARNAEKMGIDLAQVDYAVISHGHHDHGGGLKTFLAHNQKAPVYFQNNAFEPHYSIRHSGETAFIGLDPTLLPNERFVFCGDSYSITETLTLFSAVEHQDPISSSNSNLLLKKGDALVPDDFSHEQNLILWEDGSSVLIAGCAHNGITNSIRRFERETGHLPDVVIGGFHLYRPGANNGEDPAVVAQLGTQLLQFPTQYYTCHCTGLEGYQQLKAVMGQTIESVSVGKHLTLKGKENKQ